MWFVGEGAKGTRPYPLPHTPSPNPLYGLGGGRGGKQGLVRKWSLALPLAYFYSTVTLLARLRGWSTSVPRRSATW
jgi:hypothetical protein